MEKREIRQQRRSLAQKGGHDMGRTSKRVRAAASAESMTPGTRQGRAQRVNDYKAGIYARLSSDQDLKKNESVETQMEIAKRYVEDWNRHHGDRIEIAGQYADLGKTGTNFDRDEFKRLMQDIRLGDINCVIVKDLSRFGRNYLEAGNYIEKIFPFLGVRFIAVADGYDTGAEGSSTKQMASEIKNLVNDMYAKDFSSRAKLSMKQRREAGSYVGGPPPYGYEAYREGRLRKLKPDGNTVEIVRFIYKKFLETESYQAVADELNGRRINPPAVYKKSKEACCPAEAAYKGWDKGAVERILKSAAYTGDLVQGRTSLTARKEEKRVRRPEEEWVRKENTHEAVVSREIYGQAQEIHRRIQGRTRSHGHPTKGCPIGENIFGKVLYCGVCGRKMTRHSYVKDYEDGRRERKDGYFCLDSVNTKRETCPESNRISKAELADFLSFLFQAEFAIRLKRQKDYVGQGQALVHQKKQELEQRLCQTEGAMAALLEEEGEKYIAYRLGNLPQEEYARYRLWKEERLRELEKQKKRYQEEEKKLERKGGTYLKAVRSLIKLKSGNALLKELVEALIERIYVYPGKRAEIVFTYADIRREGVE